MRHEHRNYKGAKYMSTETLKDAGRLLRACEAHMTMKVTEPFKGQTQSEISFYYKGVSLGEHRGTDLEHPTK